MPLASPGVTCSRITRLGASSASAAKGCNGLRESVALGFQLRDDSLCVHKAPL